MNKLEEKILNAINDNNVWLDSGALMPFTLTSVIEDIAIEQMKGLLEWFPMNVVMAEDDYYYLSLKDLKPITVDEIISAYLKTLS